MKLTRFLACIGLLVCALAAHAESQLIAQLLPGTNPQSVAVAAGVIYRDKTPNGPFALYGVPVGMDIHVAQGNLQAAAGVVWAEDNVELSSPENLADRRGTVLKGSSLSVIGGRASLVSLNTNMLGQVNWTQGLASSAGRTVKLAILDTGLSKRQPQLWAKVVASMDATATLPKTRDAFKLNVDDIPNKTDSNHNGTLDEATSHGTMIAGIVDQVAPQVQLVVVKVADSDGQASAWTLTQGLTFAAVNGAEVANISMGSVTQIAALSDVVEWAETQGVLPVVAIGNGDVEDALFPARLSKVLCVSGLDSNSVKATFSNWDGGCDSSAPAVGISSQWWDGTLGIWSGTSFSAPFVAAGLADCLRRTNTRDPRSLIGIVEDSGRDIDPLNPDYRRKLGTLLDIQHLNTLLVGP